MAYMSQERKAELAPAIKAVLKKYGVKGSISVNNHSTLCVTLKSGKVDFMKDYGGQVRDYIQVNPYWYQEHFEGKSKKFLSELIPAMMKGNHDNSDIQTDYFDVGWYISVNVGKWNKSYELTK